jgi:hypothetical protein
LLALAVWLAGMPGLVGLYLREAVADWLQESQHSAEIEYSPGWFGSQATYQPDPNISLSLAARHFPALKPGWVALDGDLSSPFTPEGAQIRAHLGLTGSWHLSTRAATFKLNPGSGLAARDLILNVAQIPDQPASMTLNAAELVLPAHSEPLLDLRVRGMKRQVNDETVRLGLDIQARDARLGKVELILQAGPLTTEHLEILIQALNQLTASQPGSVSENLALLSLGSVWQQMASHGLIIELESLRFGDATAFEGLWATAQSEPMISGTGDLETLENWLNRLISNGARTSGTTPVDAARLLSDFGQINVDEGRFVFRSQALLQPAP